MNAQIVCRLKGGGKLSFSVGEKGAVVGRDPGLAVTVPADGVSRQHARISWDGGSYWIEDLKSTNGTFINGVDVAREGKERLRHLDVITLGRAVDLLFLVRDAAPSAVTRTGILSARLVPEEGDAIPYEIGMGEVTLGRSPANNVVVDSSAVSKLHAKILRTTESLVLQDLGSSNGTFVNGVRVMTALLGGGDRLSLGGVAAYRVQVTVGEITSLPEARGTGAKVAAPEFSADWKTRYEWDSGEYASLEALRRKIREGEAGDARELTSPLKPVSPQAPAPAKAEAQPQAPPKPQAKPEAQPERPLQPQPQPQAAPKPPQPPATAEMPAVAAKPKAPAASPAAPPTIAAKAPARAPSIRNVQLVGPGVDLSVTEPGTYEMGRLSGAALRILHPTVSRRQAVLTLAADRASVRLAAIAGAASPTSVNGRNLGEAPVDLTNGDKVLMGEVALVVRIES